MSDSPGCALKDAGNECDCAVRPRAAMRRLGRGCGPALTNAQEVSIQLHFPQHTPHPEHTPFLPGKRDSCPQVPGNGSGRFWAKRRLALLVSKHWFWLRLLQLEAGEGAAHRPPSAVQALPSSFALRLPSTAHQPTHSADRLNFSAQSSLWCLRLPEILKGQEKEMLPWAPSHRVERFLPLYSQRLPST